MSLDSFKASRKGSLIEAILASDEELARMEAKALAGRPAVEAVGARIEAEVGRLDDDEKKLVGRWVKELLARRGWTPAKKGRVRPGNLFARGTVYRRAGLAVGPVRDAQARVEAARAILAQTPHPVMSSEELISERRKAAERGE